VNEGVTKKERKDSDVGPKKQHIEDGEGEDEDDKHVERPRRPTMSTRRISVSDERPIQRQYSNGSPTQRRTVSKDQSYFDSKLQKGKDAAKSENDTKTNFGDYRDSAVFSEDGQSPPGNLSCWRLC